MYTFNVKSKKKMTKLLLMFIFTRVATSGVSTLKQCNQARAYDFNLFFLNIVIFSLQSPTTFGICVGILLKHPELVLIHVVNY